MSAPGIAGPSTMWSQLALKQPGIFPQFMTGEGPHALFKGALGAGLGYVAAPMIAKLNPRIDKDRLRKVMTVGGGLAGIGSSVPGLYASHQLGEGWWNGHPMYTPQAKTAESGTRSKIGDSLLQKAAASIVKLDIKEKQPFINYANKIPQSDLFTGKPGYGREHSPHITLHLGKGINQSKTMSALHAHGPIHAELGTVTSFKRPDYDVLKVAVKGDTLHTAKKSLRSAMPHEKTKREFNPHITLAYLKPGKAQKYVGDTTFDGTNLHFKSVSVQQSRRHTPKYVPLQKAAADLDSMGPLQTIAPFMNPVAGQGYSMPPIFMANQAMQTVMNDPIMSPVQKVQTMTIIRDAVSQNQRPLLTTKDLVRAAVGTGIGYAEGAIAGKIMGAVFGLPPQTQQTISRIGAFGGLLKATGILGD